MSEATAKRNPAKTISIGVVLLLIVLAVVYALTDPVALLDALTDWRGERHASPIEPPSGGEPAA